MPGRSDAVTGEKRPPAPSHTPDRVAKWVRHVARTQQKTLGVATTIAALILIARLTLKPMGGSLPTQFDVCILCGSRGTADFLLNIVMFAPLGIGLRLTGMRRRTIMALAVLFTCTIEALQYYVVPGRDSDLSGIIANSSGAAIGVALTDLRRTLLAPAAAIAGRLAAAAAFAACAAAAGTYWLLTPVLPHSIYYEQIAPDLPGYSPLDGPVLAASFDGAPVRIGRLSADSSDAMRIALLAGGAVIVATIQPGTTRPELAPIVAVHDQKRREVFLLARHTDDLILRLRRRSDVLGFQSPSATFPRAFAAHPSSGDTATIKTTLEPVATTFDITRLEGGRVRSTHLRVGEGIWDAWRLFIPDDGRWGAHVQSLAALWVAALFCPIGYWAGRAARREGMIASLATPLLPLVASLAIIPWAAGGPLAPWPIWAAAAVGSLLAWGLARWIDV
jgi:hypothetical protein